MNSHISDILLRFAMSLMLLVRVPQRNRTNKICVELAHETMGAEKSEICRVGEQAGNSGKSHCWSLFLKPIGWKLGHDFYAKPLVGIMSSLANLSFLLRPSTHEMRSSHIMDVNLFYSK